MENEKEHKCPIWIHDEPAISNLLRLLVDKLDRSVKPSARVTKKTVPELFDFNTSDTRYIWSLINLLQTDHCILDITCERPRSGHEEYESAKVRLIEGQETTVRRWLDRPRVLDKERWNTAVKKHEWDNAQQKAVALGNPIAYPGKSADVVVAALLCAKSAMTKNVTLRTLSAKCFWGDSKFLDNRFDYLSALFPDQAVHIKPRQLIVNAYLPEHLTSVVLIENQDTFLLLTNYAFNTPASVTSNLNGIAFVYCAGFRGTASRIREEGNTAFAFLSETNTRSEERFRHWWMKKEEYDIKPFFWGDMDYSGLAILAALQTLFPGICAWKLGYAPMVEYHNKGIHHAKSSANKENQKAVETCGCEYADSVLLPLIRQGECFIDQEVVDISDLEDTREN